MPTLSPAAEAMLGTQRGRVDADHPENGVLIPRRITLHPGNPKLIADIERELHDALNTIADDDL